MKLMILSVAIILLLFSGCATTQTVPPTELESTTTPQSEGEIAEDDNSVEPTATETPAGVRIGGSSDREAITENPHKDDVLPTPPVAVESGEEGNETAVEAKKEATIRIIGKNYIPDTITIEKGTTVIWKNEDMVAGRTPVIHMLVEHHGEFRSGQFRPGETWSHVFNKTGTYTYMDPIYKEIMRGMIIVIDPTE